MIEDENDPLLHHLLELIKELDVENIAVILGGGMSLYIRLKIMSPPTLRYPFDIQVRSTNDLDLFLSSELIIDAGKIEGLRKILARLDYASIPEAKNFQFSKKTDLYGQEKAINIDLLAPAPAKSDRAKVEIKKPRIKPVGVHGIHAYLTIEAAGIDIGRQAVDVHALSKSLTLKNQVLFLPSAYNYLILKLHAFEDRKNREDAKSDFGRHHAFDIFATVARVGEQDWNNAKQHHELHKEQEYLRKTIDIRRHDFSKPSDLGLIRLRESESYRRNREIYDSYLENFIQDLADLFP